MLSYSPNSDEWEGRRVCGRRNGLEESCMRPLRDKLTESIKGRKAPLGSAKGFLREATFDKTIHGAF